MGFGLMGAGAAVSGLMGGYQQGRKFAIEEEEAEDRKKLRGLQMRQGEQSLKKGEQDLKRGEIEAEEAGLRLGATKRDLDLDKADQDIVDRAGAEIQAWNNRPPATPGAAAPVEGQPAGITPPGGATPPARTPFQVQQQMYSQLLENSLKRRGTNKAEVIKQMLGGARMFKMAETQATLDAMSEFESGVPQEQIFAGLRANGRDIQEGTTMRVVQKPLYEGSKQMVPDVEIALPNGQVVSRSNLARTMLDPKQLMDSNTEMGKLVAQVSHYAAIEEMRRKEIAAAEARDTRQHAERMAQMRAQTEQMIRQSQTRDAEAAANRFALDYNRFQGIVERDFGYRPLDEKTRMEIELKDGKEAVAKAERRSEERGWAVNQVMTIMSMNVDPKTGRFAITPAEARRAYDTSDVKRIKTDDDGVRRYVMIGNTKVLVPSPTEEAAAPAPAPAPAPGKASPGVSAPPGSSPPAAPVSSTQITDAQILAAIKSSGMAGYKEKLLGPRPGIRNSSGVSAWDREAAAIDARVGPLVGGRQPASR